MADLIERYQAIDALKSRKTAEQSRAGIMRNAVVDFCIGIVKKLPSAQPEKRTEERTETHGVCLDTISRQQAIEALKICDANYDGTNCDKCPLRDDRWNGAWRDDETDCHTKLMRDTAKLLETLSAQPEQQWIPCSERLPEKNGVYIVSYEDAVTFLEWFNGKWFFYPSNPAREETGTITAWMPLPEPYQEGEQE